MKFSIQNYINEHSKILNKIDTKSLEKAVDFIYDFHIKGKKIFTCGNGGSASTASHMITDWNKMTMNATKKKIVWIFSNR